MYKVTNNCSLLLFPPLSALFTPFISSFYIIIVYLISLASMDPFKIGTSSQFLLPTYIHSALFLPLDVFVLSYMFFIITMKKIVSR